uniref:Uncharacterized protein n=1 Tax=Anguilla anguilla TaxID=7936 RepID=A0A0E9WMY1_ANGAN
MGVWSLRCAEQFGINKKSVGQGCSNLILKASITAGFIFSLIVN